MDKVKSYKLYMPKERDALLGYSVFVDSLPVGDIELVNKSDYDMLAKELAAHKQYAEIIQGVKNDFVLETMQLRAENKSLLRLIKNYWMAYEIIQTKSYRAELAESTYKQFKAFDGRKEAAE